MSGAVAASPTLVDVAAAVIQRPDGSFLLGQRPPGKVYAGYWEFPGGKVEPGEPFAAALARELHEELGIDVVRAYPWIVQRFVYPHAHVQLHFFRVVQWNGEPHPKEGQALAWTRTHALAVGPILPANGPVLKALALPTCLGITAAQPVGIPAFLRLLDGALARGLRMVMIRERTMERGALVDFAREVVQRCHAAGAIAVVNDDETVARAAGADGIHLPARRLLATLTRPDLQLVGASCHDAEELVQAQRLGLDYALLGPVQPTPSHPGQAGLGWDRTAALIGGCTLPVYAIGGMDAAALERAWLCGAHGVAMIRSAWESAPAAPAR